MRSIGYISGVLVGVLLLLLMPQVSSAQERGIEMAVALNEDGETYEVYMRPTHTIETPNRTMTAQVTLKVPHASGSDQFEVADVVSFVDGTEWQATSRDNAPAEDPSVDYLSFTVEFPLGDFDAYEWIGGQEIKAFSFKNASPCVEGGISLMAPDDPFLAPNSVSSNPGNHVDVLVLTTGEEYAYIGNYGAAEVVCDPVRDDTNFGIHLPVIRR